MVAGVNGCCNSTEPIGFLVNTVKFNEVSVAARSALTMASESHCGLA